MGIRGPAPTPTKIRVMNGNPSRRPLPENEPKFAEGIPEQPKWLSAEAQPFWDAYIELMAPSGVLRLVDAFALARLCEDSADLNELTIGLRYLEGQLVKDAKKQGQKLPAGAKAARRALMTSKTEGRRIRATMAALSSGIKSQEREFGLTPASSTRVEGTVPTRGKSKTDDIEDAMCGWKGVG